MCYAVLVTKLEVTICDFKFAVVDFYTVRTGAPWAARLRMV